MVSNGKTSCELFTIRNSQCTIHDSRLTIHDMALNKEVFRTRATSAVVFVIIMMAGLLWNHWSFLLLFSIIHFGCWWEYLKMIELIHKVSFHRLIKYGFMLMGFGL